MLIAWVYSAWTNFMPLRVDFAGKYLCAASRGGSFCTGRGGELIRAPSHGRIPLMSENRLSRMKRVVGKGFEGCKASYSVTLEIRRFGVAVIPIRSDPQFISLLTCVLSSPLSTRPTSLEPSDIYFCIQSLLIVLCSMS